MRNLNEELEIRTSDELNEAVANRVPSGDLVTAFGDIVTLMGQSDNWDYDMWDGVAEIVTRIAYDANLPKVDASPGSPEMNFYRRIDGYPAVNENGEEVYPFRVTCGDRSEVFYAESDGRAEDAAIEKWGLTREEWAREVDGVWAGITSSEL